MPSERTSELKLAVLIDADNIPYANVKGMMEEIAKYGTPDFQTNLWRLDPAHHYRLERRSVAECHYANPTIQLHLG